MKNGLAKIRPDGRDYSFLHTFGATTFDTKGLPQYFSIYDERPIPNQDESDIRFSPALPPLPFACTAESGTFAAGLEDEALYNPQDLYEATPGNPNEGRDIRAMLQTLIDRGVEDIQGKVGNKRTAYFNCYGSGAIDDFDAARIAVWINQSEKRSVIAGTWWYPEFSLPKDGFLATPSFNTAQATLHCHLITGFESTYKDDYLQDISWQGEEYGDNGIVYISREIYNALMAQPYTGAFTVTKVESQNTLPIGAQAYIDHLIYYVRNLFNV